MKNLVRIAFLFAIATPISSFADPQVVLGVSAELTGEGSTFGQDIRDVLIFANAQLAGNRYKLDLQDSKCDPKAGVDVAKYFAQVSHPTAVIGFGCSGPFLAGAPTFKKAKLLTMVTVASNPRIPNARERVFQSALNDQDAGIQLAKWVAQSHPKKVGVLSGLTDYCQDLKKHFVETLASEKVAVADSDYIVTETDFKSYLLKLKSAGVDSLFLNAQYEAHMSIMLRNLENLQWHPKLYSAYYPSSPAVLKESASAMEGMEFVDVPFLDDILTSEGKDIFKEFKSKYGELRSYEAIFVFVYEGFRALHLALESGQAPEKFLTENKFNGIVGDYTFDKNGSIHGINFIIKKIKDGKVSKP
jgi:ABC-type branched-subunit amino acid transport system substrate-binding protein